MKHEMLAHLTLLVHIMQYFMLLIIIFGVPTLHPKKALALPDPVCKCHSMFCWAEDNELFFVAKLPLT